MNEFIEANKHSWATIAKEHYQIFKSILSQNESTLCETQKQELGDVNGKMLIHLQFFMAWDEDKLPELFVKYPYFQKNADRDEWIGGYACEPKKAVNY
jgi:hypothetical protein